MHDRVRGSRLWSERRLSLTWPRSQCRGFLRSLIQITVTLPRRSCRSIGVRPLNFSPGVACQPPGLFSCRPLGDCKPIAINRSLPVSGQMEREHLSMRMASKRLAPFEQRIFKAPFQSAFSKRLGNHAAAVGLDVAHYNLRRAHEALRKHASEWPLGVADHVWSFGERIDAAFSTPTPTVPDRRRQFRVIEGGGSNAGRSIFFCPKAFVPSKKKSLGWRAEAMPEHGERLYPKETKF